MDTAAIRVTSIDAVGLADAMLDLQESQATSRSLAVPKSTDVEITRNAEEP
jgi:hypothetical protein